MPEGEILGMQIHPYFNYYYIIRNNYSDIASAMLKKRFKFVNSSFKNRKKSIYYLV